MNIPRKLAAVIGAALVVGGLAAAGVAYAANDGDVCVVAGLLTKAARPAGSAPADAEQPTAEDGPLCVPAIPAAPVAPAAE
ncbi:hypothetical protein [Streptosporangium sp. NPDC002607]